MNYVEDLMNEHNLKTGDYFSIKGSIKYNNWDKIFYFDSRYNLRSKSGDIIHSSIFVKLMTGEYEIIL